MIHTHNWFKLFPKTIFSGDSADRPLQIVSQFCFVAPFSNIFNWIASLEKRWLEWSQVVCSFRWVFFLSSFSYYQLKLPLLSIRPSTIAVFSSFAAAAENTVPRPLPAVLLVRACISNTPLSITIIVYSPRPLKVYVVLSSVVKWGSPHMKPKQKQKDEHKSKELGVLCGRFWFLFPVVNSTGNRILFFLTQFLYCLGSFK